LQLLAYVQTRGLEGLALRDIAEVLGAVLKIPVESITLA
jgi:hypothetical protein